MPECWPQSWDAASDRRQAIGDERHKAPASRAVLRELRGGNTQGRAAHLQLSERGVSHWALAQKTPVRKFTLENCEIRTWGRRAWLKDIGDG